MTRVLTKGEIFKKLQASLKRKNRAFKKLTKGEQRVAIAKDVIVQVQAKKIIPTSKYFSWGDYMEGSSWATESVVRKATVNADIDLSETLAQVQCSVCGIGSLFVGAVGLADELKTCDFMATSFTSIRERQASYLEKWFSGAQLDLVEDYFELNTNRSGPGASWKSPIAQAADKSRRLVMIMENIISNRGKFDPNKGKHSVTQ